MNKKPIEQSNTQNIRSTKSNNNQKWEKQANNRKREWLPKLASSVVFEGHFWVDCLFNKGNVLEFGHFFVSSNCVDLNEKLGYYGRISYFIPPSFFFNTFYIHFNFTVIFTFIPFDVYFPYISLFKGHLVIWCNSSHTIDFIVRATQSASI